MKTKFVLTSFLAALSGFAGFANTAKAGTDFSIRVNVGLPSYPVVIAPSYVAPVYGRGERGPDYRDHRAPAPRGYWKEIVVQTWVPARWVISHDRRGRQVRTFQAGYYTQHTDRVWVESGRDHGRPGRG